MKIKVTQKDIDRGGTDADTCPIALAVHRALRRCPVIKQEKVMVLRRWCRIGDKSYRLPAVAKYFVSLYDAMEYVKPIQFDLEI